MNWLICQGDLQFCLLHFFINNPKFYCLGLPRNPIIVDSLVFIGHIRPPTCMYSSTLDLIFESAYYKLKSSMVHIFAGKVFTALSG